MQQRDNPEDKKNNPCKHHFWTKLTPTTLILGGVWLN